MHPHHFSFRFNDLRIFFGLSTVRRLPGKASGPITLQPGRRQPRSIFGAPKAALWSAATALIASGLAGCQDPQPRTYTEVAFKPNPAPMAGMMGAGPMMGGGMMPGMTNASPVDIKVTWVLPESWLAKDSANGMRIGSFGIPDPALANMGELDPKAVDVSVVQLAGNAGGLNANIARWMGQVGIKATAEEMESFVKTAPHFKSKTGQDGMFVDLTDKLSGDMTQSKSIYGAVIATPDYTVFIKAMGERERVIQVKAQVKKFCESVSITGPQA
jgi:hypothetical protein